MLTNNYKIIEYTFLFMSPSIQIHDRPCNLKQHAYSLISNMIYENIQTNCELLTIENVSPSFKNRITSFSTYSENIMIRE